jgi:glucose-1-phosphate adenylyltransferase
MASELPLGQLPRHTLALVLAGGRGSRLKQLTDRRAKPSVYFGGKYRIIDFVLSNCINSGFRRIAVLTQYKAHSLMRHLQQGWSFLRADLNEFVEVWPAQQRISEDMWYRGTADAVYQNLDIIQSLMPKHIVILAGDHIYKQDYSIMLEHHVRLGSAVTVGCVEVPRMEATDFGVMHVDEEDRIISFVEKPVDPPAIPGQPDRALASMGIYIFNAEVLYSELDADALGAATDHDFGKNIIPSLVAKGAAIRAHRLSHSCVSQQPGHEPYWRDVGTLDAYHEAHMDLCSVTPSLDLYDPSWPIWTLAQQAPPAKFVHDDLNRRGEAVSSLVSGGCIISGSSIRRSIVSYGSRCNSFSWLDECVILPEVDVARHARLTRCIVDRGVRIPEGLVVGEDAELDARRFYRTAGGITLITQEMLDALAKA